MSLSADRQAVQRPDRPARSRGSASRARAWARTCAASSQAKARTSGSRASICGEAGLGEIDRGERAAGHAVAQLDRAERQDRVGARAPRLAGRSYAP